MGGMAEIDIATGAVGKLLFEMVAILSFFEHLCLWTLSIAWIRFVLKGKSSRRTRPESQVGNCM